MLSFVYLELESTSHVSRSEFVQEMMLPQVENQM